MSEQTLHIEHGVCPLCCHFRFRVGLSTRTTQDDDLCSHGILFRLVADFPSQHWHSKSDFINREQSASENLYTKKGTICQGKLQIIKESIFTGSMR